MQSALLHVLHKALHAGAEPAGCKGPQLSDRRARGKQELAHVLTTDGLHNGQLQCV